MEIFFESDRKPDHEDERRALWTAFNGETFGGDENFRASEVSALWAQDGSGRSVRGPKNGRELLMVLGGTVCVLLDKRSIDMAAGDRLIIPAGVR